MINNLALTPLLGLPMVAWGGLMTLGMLLLTATVAYRNSVGKPILPFEWHPRLARITVIFALVHGLFGLSVYLGF